jgi:hypothetical protein
MEPICYKPSALNTEATYSSETLVITSILHVPEHQYSIFNKTRPVVLDIHKQHNWYTTIHIKLNFITSVWKNFRCRQKKNNIVGLRSESPDWPSWHKGITSVTEELCSACVQGDRVLWALSSFILFGFEAPKLGPSFVQSRPIFSVRMAWACHT